MRGMSEGVFVMVVVVAFSVLWFAVAAVLVERVH